MQDYYSTKEAADLTGASRQIIRTYTNTYQRYFSTEGAPAQPGQPRRFTAGDLKLIRFIYTSTAEQKLTHEQVQDRLAAGALEQFTWQPPEEPAERQGEAESSSGALIPVERFQAAQALLLDAQRRERKALDRLEEQQNTLLNRERELQREINRLQNELGKAQGELAGLKAVQRRPPRWWYTLFGGRE